MDKTSNGRSSLDAIREKAAWAQKQEQSARDRLQQAERAREFWSALESQVADEHPAQVLLLLRRADGYLRSLRASSDPIAPVLDGVRRMAEERALDVSKAFQRDFPAAVRSAGLEIDSTSRHPRYTLERGFIRVEVDDKALIARVAPRDGELTEIGIDVEPLVAKIKSEHSRIFERPLQAEPILKSMYTAYLATLRAEKREEGEEVPLRRLTNRLARNLKQFAGDEFNVDLARLIKTGNMTYEGKRMHLNHTRNQRQGILLYGLEDGGYVGFISFRREDG